MKGSARGVLKLSSIFAAAALLVVSPSRAQDGAKTDAARAVTLAREAKLKYDRGDWAGALQLFQVAETNAHSPVLLLYVARCERNLGHLLRAREQYQRVAHENLPPNAPEPFLSARAEAQKDLEALASRIGKVAIDASAVPSAAIDVDGAPVSREDPRLELDPGAHVARARVGEREVARSTFRVEDGQAITVQLRPGPAVVARPKSSGEAARGSLAPGGLVLGVGLIGIAVGVGTRVVAFNDVAEVKSRCDGDHCLKSDQPKISSAENLQTASTIALAVGGAALAAGLTLLVIRPGGEKANVGLRIAPTSIGVAGTF